METTVPEPTDSRRFEPGELVNIRIDRARIEPGEDVGLIPVSIGNWRTTINVRNPDVVVERVAPKEWPPRLTPGGAS